MLADEQVERYELLGELATGGMATVYLGRQRGPYGFARTVAIKSMHPQYAKDDGFRAMFLDEATLTARIRHPNVVATLDIVDAESKLLLVMEYVEGVALSTLLRSAMKRPMTIPPAAVSAIVCDLLQGLHSAHELADDEGKPLAVVHRDVSPQNVLVGVDGLARVLDFGVAKASTRRHVTQSGEVKGKLAYMSPEQLRGELVDRRTDVYAAGVVLWESLTGRRLFDASNDGELMMKILEGKIAAPSAHGARVSEAVDRIVYRALTPRMDERWASAAEMAHALAQAIPPAPRAAVTDLVKDLAGAQLAERTQLLRSARTPLASASDLATDEKMLLDALTKHATIGVEVPARPPRRSRSVLAPILGVLAVVALTGGAFAIGSRSGRSKVEVVSEPPRASVAAATAIPEAPAPIVTPAPPPASASASVATSASVRAPARPRGGRTIVPNAPSTHAAPAATVDCRMPYTVDEHGDRHYKPECVQ